jgi:sugar phosphate isomerase/epimerase
LKLAAESQAYCDEVKGIAAQAGLAVTELSTHLQGQLVASHPAFDTLLDGFAPPELPVDAKAGSVGGAATALGGEGQPQAWPEAHATFSGALAWPFFYPWPQRPAGLIDEAFKELGRALAADSAGL